MPGMTADVHTACDIDPGDSSNMSFLLAFEFTQAAPHSSTLKDFASINIRSMLVTLVTSHFEISQLKDVAPMNMPFMSTTLDTSQFETSPLNFVLPNI